MGAFIDGYSGEEEIEAKYLKTCPFCGGKVTLSHFWTFDDDGYYVACDNDDCLVRPMTEPMGTAQDAIDVWDKRF